MTRSIHLKVGIEIVIRSLAPGDSMTELTELLHRAYNATMDAGVVFYASHQSEEDTRRRIEGGYCFIGSREGTLVSTITIYPPHTKPEEKCEWYNRDGVCTFGQFGVEPSLQKSGLGTAMMKFIEDYARAHGAAELALDTAENAANLIAFYESRGFRKVGNVKWESVSHHSVVFSKRLQ